jgi:hypothetical protein
MHFYYFNLYIQFFSWFHCDILIPLRRIFGLKRDEVTEGWNKFHNEKLHSSNLYSSPNIRTVILRTMRWAGHVASEGKLRNAYKILVGKSERKRAIGGPKCRWEDNIKMNLREIGWRAWTEFIWLRIGTVVCSYEHGNEPFGSIKDGEFLD